MAIARFFTLTFSLDDDLAENVPRIRNFAEDLDRAICRDGRAMLMGEDALDRVTDILSVEVYKKANISAVSKAITSLLNKHSLSAMCRVRRHTNDPLTVPVTLR
jgi:hypothetical protein